MKRVLLHLASAALLLLLAAVTAFGGGFQLNEHGARAMAQGGAWAARASDLSAMYFNPAGLANQHGMNFLAGATIIVPKASFWDTYGNETKMVDQIFNPINIYGSYEITDGLVAGMGINNPFGLGTEWPAEWTGKYITTKIDLQSFFFTPTIAYRVMDGLSVAVGANIVTGAVTIKKSVAIPFNWPAPVVDLDLNATGFGFNAGVLYQVMPEVSLGASYRSAVKLDATGTATFKPNYVELGLPGGDAAASLELPATGFVGVSVKPMDNLEVEADYQFVGWSSYDKLVIEFKKDPSKNSIAPKNYNNSYILRFGAEYTMDDLQFRAGFLYDNSPVEDHYLDPMLPDASRSGYTFGVGYNATKDIRIDAAYMYLPFNDRTATDTEVKLDGSYKTIVNLFALNIGWSL